MPMRTEILFEAIYRLYIDNGTLKTEHFYHDSIFLSTLGYQGDFSEEVTNSLDIFFDDPLEFMDSMLAYDPKFRVDLKNEEDAYIHIIGEFKEEVFTEGSWEEGYYDCLRLIPIIRGYEVVEESDVLWFLKTNGEKDD